MRRGAVCALSGMVLAACIRPPVEVGERPPDPSPPAGYTPVPIDVGALEREVARLRKLPLEHPVDVQAVQQDELRDLVGAGVWQARRGIEERNAFWSAFGVTTTGVSPGDAERQVDEDSVVGFYDSKRKKLFVRGTLRADGTIEPLYPGTRLVLAHELVHALEDRAFDLGVPSGLSADEALARSALVEGDAVLTSYAVQALERDDFDAWRAQILDPASPTASKIVAPDNFTSRALRSAPEILRRTSLFPYVEGMGFVVAIYRAGGFDLIDKAFIHPPASTEQVIHPEKYFAGELPVPVSWTPPPPGWEMTAHGVMGELRTVALLAGCGPAARDRAAGTGWGGDAWSVVADADGHSAMLWSTVWDDEVAAIRFEGAARARAACVGAAPPFTGVGREVAVRREGRRVEYVQGLPEGLREPTMRSMLAMPYDDPAPRPPFQ